MSISEVSYVTFVSDVDYPNGQVKTCYGVVREDGSAIAITLTEAITLQRMDIPFIQPHVFYPADFTAWEGPIKPYRGDPRNNRWNALDEWLGS